MKCVRLKSMEIKRVPDKEAIRIVKLGNGNYCPKLVYKGIRRKK